MSNKRGLEFCSFLSAHMDKQILHACRFIKKAVAIMNAAMARNLKPNNTFKVRKKLPSAESEHIKAICFFFNTEQQAHIKHSRRRNAWYICS